MVIYITEFKAEWMNKRMVSKMTVANCLHENWLSALNLKTSPWTYYECISVKGTTQ